MRLKHLAALAVSATLALASGCTEAFAAHDSTTKARSAPSMPEALFRLNGQPLHRFTLTPDNTTAESNLTAAGGTAVTYTLTGSEHLCLQAVTTDAYVEVIAAGSMTAAGAKGWFVDADQSLWANCFTLQPDARSVSALCTAAGPCIVKGFELQ